MFAAFSRGHTRTVTAFHPYCNSVPSVLEPGSIRTGTKFHRRWNRVPSLLEPEKIYPPPAAR